MSVQVQSHQIELALMGAVTRIEISVSDEQGRPVDPKELKLTVMDMGSNPLFTDILFPSTGEEVSPLPSRIVRDAKGRYYFPFGADNGCGFPATFFGNLPPSPTWDLSGGAVLSASFDGRAFLPVTITAADITAVTPIEVVNSINAAFAASNLYGALYARVARYHCGHLFLTSPLVHKVTQSQVKLDQTVVGNAATSLFGVIPATVIVNGRTSSPLVQALYANRTENAGDALFHWTVTAAKGLGSANVIQVVKVASAHAFSILPYFRTEIDKALKSVNQDAARTGYTDAQLMGYLALAVTEINAYQPITNMSLESFPTRDFMMILIWTATIIALISQGLFAIDTDIDYSDRGASFRMEHASKLQGYINMITSRLQAQMTQFKLQFAPIGVVKYEAGANYRLAQVLQASPEGSLFRGLFTRT